MRLKRGKRKNLSFLPLLSSFFSVQLRLDLRVRNGHEPFHEVLEFGVLTRIILGGRFGVTTHKDTCRALRRTECDAVVCEKQGRLRSENQVAPSLFDFFGYFSVLWKDYPMSMQVTALSQPNEEQNKFSLSGICPHCNRDSVFTMVTPSFREVIRDRLGTEQYSRYAAATQCQGCKKFVLAVVTRRPNPQNLNQLSHEPIVYEAHYPLGKPDDSIDEGIPEEIGNDFKEALRCMFVDAFKATVCMCGRALESACSDLKAEGKTLEDKIDDLENKRLISLPLKDLAHRIRLTRNRGCARAEE